MRGMIGFFFSPIFFLCVKPGGAASLYGQVMICANAAEFSGGSGECHEGQGR